MSSCDTSMGDYVTPELIKIRLSEVFPGAVIDVEDTAGDFSHYKIVVRSRSFSGMKLIDQHRMVKNALQPDIMSKIHAVELQTFDI